MNNEHRAPRHLLGNGRTQHARRPSPIRTAPPGNRKQSSSNRLSRTHRAQQLPPHRPHAHTPGRRERRHRTAVSRHTSAPRPRLRDRRSLHDFMMLNPLRQRAASTAAIEQAVHVLRKALGTN